MDFKNKYLLGTLRILLGLLFLMAGIMGYLSSQSLVQGNENSGVPEESQAMTLIYWDTGIIQLAKLVEVLIGLMLIFNILPALASNAMAPLSIGFIVINTAMGNSFGIILSLIILAINLYFGYVYWDKYKAMFEMKKYSFF
jgi:uncharacterized membrane protein YphA (DoxX/SURF4 family)